MSNLPIAVESIILATRIECIKSILFGFKGRKPENMSEEEFEKFIEQTKSQIMVFVGNPDMEPLDEKELFEAARKLNEQASWQESAAILNPSYPLSKNDVIREQAKALNHLGNFVTSLKKCQELKGKVKMEMDTKDAIGKLFI